MDFLLYCQNVIWVGGESFFCQKICLKKPNTPEYAQVLVVLWAKLNSVTALLSPRPTKQHLYVICEGNTTCDKNGCVKRHPKPCKFFARNNKCKFKKCAYMHVKNEDMLKTEVLEKQIHILTQDNLKKTNKKIANNESELCSSIADLVERLNALEQRQKDLLESVSNSKEIPVDVTAGTDRKKVAAENAKDETTKRNKTNDTSSTNPEENVQCNQCNFKTN